MKYEQVKEQIEILQAIVDSKGKGFDSHGPDVIYEPRPRRRKAAKQNRKGQ